MAVVAEPPDPEDSDDADYTEVRARRSDPATSHGRPLGGALGNAVVDAVLGEAMNLVVDASDTAAYHDGSSVVSTFSQDQFVVRAIQEHDFVMRREESVCVMNQVTWGA